MLWQWLTVIALAMTPALLLGQSAAAGAGIGFGFDPRILVPVIAVASFVEGLFVAWLGGKSANVRIGIFQRLLDWMRKPRAIEYANRFGPWGGMILGVALVGQEPILLALRWLGIDFKRLILPTAVSNAVFAVLYYYLVKLGVLSVATTLEPLKDLF